MTLSELIDDTERRLTGAGVHFGHGTLNARDEAAWLVLHALGLPLDTDLHEVAQRPLTVAEHASASELLEQRINTRQPLAYLTREAWLQGVPFYVDERTIVPRSLIAEAIAEGSIDPWLSGETRRVLDLCTGNGSLAVLAAMAWPEISVDAADISADALAVARINVDKHGLAERIRLIESDGLVFCLGACRAWIAESENGPQRGQFLQDSQALSPYDLILCNPPYVNRASMDALPPEFRAEPSLALAGGTDGMDFVRSLLAASASALAPHGILVLEIGHEREHFEAAFPHLSPVWLYTSAGSDQVLLLTAAMLAP